MKFCQLVNSNNFFLLWKCPVSLQGFWWKLIHLMMWHVISIWSCNMYTVKRRHKLNWVATLSDEITFTKLFPPNFKSLPRLCSPWPYPSNQMIYRLTLPTRHSQATNGLSVTLCRFLVHLANCLRPWEQCQHHLSASHQYKGKLFTGWWACCVALWKFPTMS